LIRKNEADKCPFGLSIPKACQEVGIAIDGMVPVDRKFLPEGLKEKDGKYIREGNLKIYERHKNGGRCPYAKEIMVDEKVVNCNFDDTAEGMPDIKWFKGSTDAFKYWQGNVWGDYFTPLGRGWSGADYYVPGTSPMGYLSLNAKENIKNTKQNEGGIDMNKKAQFNESNLVIVEEEPTGAQVTVMDPPGEGDVGVATFEVSEEEAIPQENPETVVVEEDAQYGPKEMVFNHEEELAAAEEDLKRRQDEKAEDVKWDGNLKTFMDYMRDALQNEVPTWVRDIMTEGDIGGYDLRQRKRLLSAAKDWWDERAKEMQKAMKQYNNKRRDRRENILGEADVEQIASWQEIAEKTLNVFDRLLHPEQYEGGKKKAADEGKLEKTAIAEIEKEEEKISKAIQEAEDLSLTDIVAFDEKRKTAKAYALHLRKKFAEIDRERRKAKREALVKEAYTPDITVVPDKFLWDLTRDLINHVVANNGNIEETFEVASREFNLDKREAYQIRNLLKDAGYPVRWSSRLFCRLPENYQA
jgi:hypothetical protein